MSPSTLHPPIHQGLPHPRSSTLNKRILKREKRNCLSDTWHRSQTRTHEDCFFFHRLVLVWRGLWSNWGWAEWSLAATTTLLLPKAPRGCAGGRSQKFTPNKGLPLSSWTSFMGSHQWMMDDTENGCKCLPYNRSYWTKNSQKSEFTY